MDLSEELDSKVHCALLSNVARKGFVPGDESLAAELSIDEPLLHLSLRRLAENHGLVLHPGTLRPWVIHPFSLSPTQVWVRNGPRGWWAPCIWCAMGITTLVGGSAEIKSAIGAEDERVTISVKDFQIADPSLLVHFSIPPRDAWANVVHFCSTVLPFRNETEVDDWCARHRLNRGEVITISKVLELARLWYGRHLEPNWRKWTISEARDIFSSVGLREAFWNLPLAEGRY